MLPWPGWCGPVIQNVQNRQTIEPGADAPPRGLGCGLGMGIGVTADGYWVNISVISGDDCASL